MWEWIHRERLAAFISGPAGTFDQGWRAPENMLQTEAAEHCGTYIIYHHLLGPCTPTPPSGSKYLSKACKNIVPDRCCVPFFFLSFFLILTHFCLQPLHFISNPSCGDGCVGMLHKTNCRCHNPLKLSSPICYLAEGCDTYILFSPGRKHCIDCFRKTT